MPNGFTKAGDKILGIMPVLGLGTWELTGQTCIESVISALRLGYRHIDTAQMYGNEKEVGKGIWKSGLKREEIFITTKVSTGNLTPSRIRRTTTDSLEKLQSGYVDLLLIHWPTSEMDLEACLEAMFELRDKGQVRYVGVSNFDPPLFRKALSLGPVLTNQVEFTPYDLEFENLEIARTNDKIITAYSPLARGAVTKDPILTEIGKKYGKTAAQVTLRWLIQLKNVAVIPKASGEKHLIENMGIFDFELSAEDIQKINQFSKKTV
jgi:diketogulonate reductase-like aldo/keto reductase